MASVSESALHDLRQKYNAAYSAYKNATVTDETKALRELTDARANLLAAILAAITEMHGAST